MLHAQVRCEEPPHVLVLGDTGVGGSSVVHALRALAANEGVAVAIDRGLRRSAAPGYYAEVRTAYRYIYIDL